ncbi:MerR family transcriptional regulator [Sulfitobacter sp. M57]|uniref:MerR family transcriptional regulator n=1 Tax=unclassified Sulfitobacter TaxID=196795 RepID=UPI0023E1A211|nr:MULTISPECIES: MerR family transcriptional regulator [unclassified Sulfitobacter]MDF3413922.1 MerR family transcriptional regulator [Sulfitobacter sp. KE5]MDF3420797.1 MerR family transcriptional regulator [Sulfitobacter sp. KE43]MDF3432468.1 MerR family transcriptional regulator [Sulfitobacter sp. KE42]MDF3458107.1 MerR family transcriptional regulator [Sulfitobacter sp. S74]MDF3462008.1 MerR family transcriptional regulator [Sulfitobacter sp. Ks18]
MPKSADAFRTISEVADWLGIQAHVLRFWESKFTQVRPVKRAGGRRYYRPNDMLLLGGIRQLLHEDGLTIKGVQKILREEGMSHVASLSQPLDELTQSLIDETPPTPFIEAPEAPQEETGVVLSFDKKPAQADDTAEQQPTEDVVKGAAPEPQEPTVDAAEVAPDAKADAQADQVGETAKAIADSAQQSDAPAPEAPLAEKPVAEKTESETASLPSAPAEVPEPTGNTPRAEEAPEVAQEAAVEPAPPVNEHITIVDPAPAPRPEPDFEKIPLVADEPKVETESEVQETTVDTSLDEAEPTPVETHPQTPDTDAAQDAQASALPADPAPEPASPAAPKPRVVDLPALTPEHQITAHPAILSAAYRHKQITKAQARKLAPLLDKLTILRDSMAATRSGATQTGASPVSND